MREVKINRKPRNQPAKTLVVFNPIHFPIILEKMNIDINVMAKKLNQLPSSLRKWMHGDVKKPNLKTVVDITEYVDYINTQRTYRKNTKRIPLPAKVTIINPVLFEEELKKRGISNSELFDALKKSNETISFSTLNKYIRNDFGTFGPSYPISLVISNHILNFPKLTAKERAAKKSKYLVSDFFDDDGKPQLSDEKTWDFYTAQKEWIERDKEKLKNLPRSGSLHAGRHQKK